MTMRARSLPSLGVAACALLLLTACAPEPAPEPVPTGSVVTTPTPTPTPTAEALVVPERVAGELARTVFLEDGPDGVPTAESEILDAPLPGVEYVAEAQCTAPDPATRVAFRIERTDDRELVMEGDMDCATPWTFAGPLDADVPLQASFTSTDGATAAYVRIVPADAVGE